MNSANSAVRAWTEEVVIPTYPVGQPEKNPMFLEKRVYQGSSGVVYPHAVIEKIYDEKVDKTYKAVFLENEYIRMMVLPELGGRIQMAYDKIRQRHFIYYNQVIKPALVGLTGPWISGGIEFNWPQHHRPSTFDPIDSAIEEHEDGSKTIWVNEVEKMFHTKGMAGFTLYPGKAYIEIKGKLFNRTPFPQTFLWWANPAVKVNDHYQSIFPPDVHAVFDHGRRDVSSFPIATGTYYKVNYAPGTDISFYRNIPVPTSFMAAKSDYNFIGGYEHDTRAGLLHVADHHVSPGKKQWTWGNGHFGQTWDKNLTDEDGPYIELMTGVFTDNQPDFSWINPNEEKSFTQYFMPYSEVGIVGNASKDAVASLQRNEGKITIKLYTTSVFEQLEVALRDGQKILWKDVIACSPGEPFVHAVDDPGEAVEPELIITDMHSRKRLLVISPLKNTSDPIPSPARQALRPEEIREIEQLYLTGLHLEQYRHATYNPVDYYREALQRDPGDTRCNNALGLWFLRRGQFSEAERHFRKAIETLTERNPNPYNGEPYYNLGWALAMQGYNDDAYTQFYKSTWNDAWQHTGFLNLARISTLSGDLEQALEHINHSIQRNTQSHTARHLRVIILRRMERVEEAEKEIEAALAIDPFQYGCLFERYLCRKAKMDTMGAVEALKELGSISRFWVNNFTEYAWDYAHAGCFEEASAMLEIYIDHKTSADPMVHYYRAWFSQKMGDHDYALKHLATAASVSPDFCFPNRFEDVAVLEYALEQKPADAKAAYYLGNFFYDKRLYAKAIECWERSVQHDDRFPTVFRNLSLAYYNKLNDPARSYEAMQKAFDLDDTDARVLMELDQLKKRLKVSPVERLKYLDQYDALVRLRDDLLLERITLLNQLEQHEQALEMLRSYRFHPWEGGEGKVVKQWLNANTSLAMKAIHEGDADTAIRLLNNARHYPENLGEGKLYNAPENDLDLLEGIAHHLKGEHDAAKALWEKALKGEQEPVQAIFYNDPQPDYIFYQALAYRMLGKKNEADELLNRLLNFGKTHYNDTIRIDYFAVSLPDLLVFDADLEEKNRIHCLYMQALGAAGMDHGAARADALFSEVLSLDPNHLGALTNQKVPALISFIDQQKTNAIQ